MNGLHWRGTESYAAPIAPSGVLAETLSDLIPIVFSNRVSPSVVNLLWWAFLLTPVFRSDHLIYDVFLSQYQASNYLRLLPQ